MDASAGHKSAREGGKAQVGDFFYGDQLVTFSMFFSMKEWLSK